MEYTYLLTDGNLKISTPGVTSMDEVKKEVLTQTPKLIIYRSTYPNGFEITIEEHPDMIFMRCNRPLIDNGDGSFTAPTDR